MFDLFIAKFKGLGYNISNQTNGAKRENAPFVGLQNGDELI